VRRGNCFVFAARAWWRWRKQGAYWALRQSRHIAGWHWLVHHRGRWIHYEPLAPRSGWCRTAVHKVWFEGRIRRGDERP
jgi:hypothetical protein